MFLFLLHFVPWTMNIYSYHSSMTRISALYSLSFSSYLSPNLWRSIIWLRCCLSAPCPRVELTTSRGSRTPLCGKSFSGKSQTCLFGLKLYFYNNDVCDNMKEVACLVMNLQRINSIICSSPWFFDRFFDWCFGPLTPLSRLCFHVQLAAVFS